MRNPIEFSTVFLSKFNIVLYSESNKEYISFILYHHRILVFIKLLIFFISFNTASFFFGLSQSKLL